MQLLPELGFLLLGESGFVDFLGESLLSTTTPTPVQIFHVHLDEREAPGVGVSTQLPGAARDRIKQEQTRLLSG